MLPSQIFERIAEGEMFVADELAAQIPEADIQFALKQHLSGIWGELGPEECTRNKEELESAAKVDNYGPDLNSLFTASNGVRFSVTTVGGRYPETFVCPVEADDMLLVGSLPPVPLMSPEIRFPIAWTSITGTSTDS